jgi:peroxiredoxin
MSYLPWISVFGIVLGLAGEVLAQSPVPRPGQELSFTLASGEKTSLTAYAGKVVVVQFLFTTCPHCQATSRSYSKLQDELGSRGLQIVGVAFNEEAERNPDMIRSYVDSNGVRFPVGVVPRESVLKYLGISVMSRFNVPQVVVIDRKGVIRAQSDLLGSDELMDEARFRPLLEGLLEEARTTGKARKPVRIAKTAAK